MTGALFKTMSSKKEALIQDGAQASKNTSKLEHISSSSTLNDASGDGYHGDDGDGDCGPEVDESGNGDIANDCVEEPNEVNEVNMFCVREFIPGCMRVVQVKLTIQWNLLITTLSDCQNHNSISEYQYVQSIYKSDKKIFCRFHEQGLESPPKHD